VFSGVFLFYFILLCLLLNWLGVFSVAMQDANWTRDVENERGLTWAGGEYTLEGAGLTRR